MSFEKEIKEKLGEHNPEEVIKNTKNKSNILFQIEELILDKIFTAEKLTEDHKKTLEKYTSLIHLTLNQIGLTSLENFPFLKNTQIVSSLFFIKFFQIELNENQLKGDDLEILLKNCPSLYKIKLEHNLIDNFDNLKCLSNYNIKKIDLEGNPLVSTNESYREELFKLVPSLECIDRLDKEGNEIESTLYGGEEEEDISEEGEEGEDEGDDEGEGEDDDEDDEEPHKKRKD